MTFHKLPLEILSLICLDLEPGSLKALSLVDHRCYAASIPSLFHEIHVSFSTGGLNNLENFSRSRLAPHVRVLHYEASEIIDPLVRHWDYFRSCIYTQQEYFRDQKEFGWGLRERCLSYTSIHSHFTRCMTDQEDILINRKDIKILCQSVPRLKGLKSIDLSFTEPGTSQLFWFGSRTVMNWEKSFPIHLEAVLNCIVSAGLKNVQIRSLQIRGFYANISAINKPLTGLAIRALVDVQYLGLDDSVSLLGWLASLPLPSLVRLDLANCWIVGSDLRTFLRIHDPYKRKLRLQDVHIPCPKVMSQIAADSKA